MDRGEMWGGGEQASPGREEDSLNQLVFLYVISVVILFVIVVVLFLFEGSLCLFYIRSFVSFFAHFFLPNNCFRYICSHLNFFVVMWHLSFVFSVTLGPCVCADPQSV